MRAGVGYGGNCDAAAKIGAAIAEKAKAAVYNRGVGPRTLSISRACCSVGGSRSCSRSGVLGK